MGGGGDPKAARVLFPSLPLFLRGGKELSLKLTSDYPTNIGTTTKVRTPMATPLVVIDDGVDLGCSKGSLFHLTPVLTPALALGQPIN